MVTIIKKGSDWKKAVTIIDNAVKINGVDTRKHCGVIKLKEDPLIIQKKLRDEWESILLVPICVIPFIRG